MNPEYLEYISELVKQGYTSGYEPTWSIDIEEDENEEDVRLQEIARLIREGYTSGYNPTWNIEIDEDEQEEE